MNKYALYLKANGDGFNCKVSEHGLSDDQIKVLGIGVSLDSELVELAKEGDAFFLYFSFRQNFELEKETIKHPVDAKDLPDCIHRALSCINRKEAELYISHYLMHSEFGTEPNTYLLKNENGTQTSVSLLHAHFYEKEADLTGHYSIKGRAHQETPGEMLQFVRYRSLFFRQSYERGRQYHDAAWLDTSWFLTFLDYHLTTFENKLAYTLFGALVLGLEPTHFCEDFNAGYNHSSDCDTSEVDMLCMR